MKISQREAHRLRKELAALKERERKNGNAWSSEWFGGVHIGSSQPKESVIAAIQTARKLGHAVVAVVRNQGDVEYYAVRP